MLDKEPQLQFQDLSLYLLNLVSTSCQILHKYSNGAELSWKGKNNPVTQVDYLIQHFIISQIKRKYGDNQIRIVAEEDLTYSTCPQFKESIQNKLSEINIVQNIKELPRNACFQSKYHANDLCVWIDPLDCTQGFINQRKHEVTILIGISFKGKPICGIIGHPYKVNETSAKNDKKSSTYMPSVYFGSSQLNLNAAFQFLIAQNQWKIRKGIHNEQQKSMNQRLTTVGYRKMSIRQQKVVKQLGLKVIRAGGAGYKCVKLINKQVGSLMFIDAKTSKWDTCAGQAIILAMGGFTSKQNLGSIQYSPDKSFQNSQGFVFTFYRNLLQTVTKIASQ